MAENSIPNIIIIILNLRSMPTVSPAHSIQKNESSNILETIEQLTK